jgi:hypothetical protein
MHNLSRVSGRSVLEAAEGRLQVRNLLGLPKVSVVLRDQRAHNNKPGSEMLNGRALSIEGQCHSAVTKHSEGE